MTAARPEGYYPKYPEVTWDLARERWLYAGNRTEMLIVRCSSCGAEARVTVLGKNHDRQIEEFIARSQHAYSCPAGQVECFWLPHVTPRRSGELPFYGGWGP